MTNDYILTQAKILLFGNEDFYKEKFLKENSDKLADTFCKMRGAALKLGQVLTLLDKNVIPSYI